MTTFCIAFYESYLSTPVRLKKNRKNPNSFSYLKFKIFLRLGLSLALATHFDVTEMVVFKFCNTNYHKIRVKNVELKT
jgi:hypothetical protein